MAISELTLKSRGEKPVCRLEIFEGSAQRREWLPEEKPRIVADSHETTESVRAVARRYALSPQQLFAWASGRRLPLAETPAPKPLFVRPVVAAPMSKLATMWLPKQRKRRKTTASSPCANIDAAIDDTTKTSHP